MKLKNCYIVMAFLCLAIVGPSCFALSVRQEPPSEKHFDPNFKQRYSGDKFNYEGKKVVSNSEVSSGEFGEFEEGDVDPVIEERNISQDDGFDMKSLQWVFYLVLAAAVVYLIFVLLNEGGAGLFVSGRHQKLNTKEAITADTIQHTDLSALITEAEDKNDYRLAVRYYYLLVLKTLSIKKIIQFEDDKTNAEYINETASMPYSTKFKKTSHLYNYVWYGEFPLNSDLYSKAKDKFVTLLSQVK